MKYRNKIFIALSFMSVFVITQICFAEIISSDRRVTWQGNVGVSGGIPIRTTICATITPTGANQTTALQSALSSCAANQVVKINSGTLVISGVIDWQAVNPGVVLRGNGPANTIIQINDGFLYMRGYWYDPSMSGSTRSNLTATPAKGATSITVTDASWVTVGNYYAISQTLDSSFMTQYDEAGPGGAKSYIYPGTRGLGEIVKVTAKNGNTLTLEIPLHYGYSTTFTAALSKIANTWGYGHGIEDLKINNLNANGDTHTIRIENQANSWVKNVEIYNTGRTAIYVDFGYRIEIRDSYIHESINASAGQGYGITLTNYTSASLVENNILRGMHLGIATNYGASGNVLAYNYVLLPKSDSGQDPAGGNHGFHSAFNLWEGNYFTAKFLGDQTHGSNSHQTFLRNKIQGHDLNQTPANMYDQTAIHIMAFNRHSNAVGNVLGLSGYSKYDVGCTNGSIYCLGDGYGGNDTEATIDLLRHGNYDYATKLQRWDSRIADRNIPNSYYLATNPPSTWWCQESTWPPVNPAIPSVSDIPAKRRHDGAVCTLSTRESETISPPTNLRVQ